MTLELPFSTQPLVLGVSGLDLHRAVDQVPPTKLRRMDNLVRNNVGELTARPGLSLLASFGSGATQHHSIGRLSNPQTSTFIRLIGSDTSLAFGTTGAFALSEAGFSGNPLTLLPYRPPQSGQTWMFVGDSTKMRKVDIAGASIQIGLPAPAAFISLPGLGTLQTTTIDTCEVAGWTNNTGTGAGAPSNATDAVNFKQGAASVQFTTNNGGGATPYYQFWNKANALDLSLVGIRTASDDDIIHLWLRADRPDLITEVRLYFVCSSTFNTATLPGTSTTLNTEAYVKAFRPSDFTPINEATSTSLAAASTVNTNQQTFQQLSAIDDARGTTVELVVQETENRRVDVLPLISGRGSWTEFGSVGIACFRGDFRRIGSDTTRTWAGVTGLVVLVQSTTTTNVNVWIDDIYMTGGYGPDTSRVGASAYDYRFTHYDPRTGAESNPSPIMAEANWVNVRRGIVQVFPNNIGDANIRQRVYRRGGALKNNWYFLGVNSADGATFTDEKSDLEAIASSTLEIDNDQPVTTVNSAGATVLAQPLPSIWGPVQDLLFGCGDPYRPGFVYWSKTGEPDSWPSANNAEVCSSSEELMAGIVWGGQSFVFSRQRLYVLIPNVAAAGTVTALPTQCARGLVQRWAVTTGAQGIYFATADGVYVTTGGVEKSISDDDLRPIFHGEVRGTYQPIDFAFPSAIRLAYHDNEVYFTYRPTGSNTRVTMVYSILYDYWRPFLGALVYPTAFYSETTSTGQQLLVGGLRNSITYTNTGTTDDEEAITCAARTGALDQGFPRQDKLYGDLILDVDRGGATVTVTVYINNEGTALAAQLLTTGTGRTRYIVNPFGNAPQQARNISVEISWGSLPASAILYSLGIAHIVQPDTTITRVTDWSPEGRLTDKYVKGLILECDTGGAAKTLDLQADGVTQTTITATASGRRVLQFPASGSTWAQFRGRLLRIVPTDTTNEWKLYRADWIFDEEPLQLLRWETQEVDHGVPVHHSLLAAFVTLRSTADVTLTITGIRQTGATFSDAYTITNTAGVKLKPFVPFNPRKAVLWKYLFTSTAQFWLYKEESEVVVQPWGGGDTITAHPFGNSDNVPRDMTSSALAALASGGRGLG